MGVLDRKEMIKLLKNQGFQLKKKNKHEQWTNGKCKILLPTGRLEARLSKKIQCDIKRGFSRVYNTVEENKI